MSKTVRTHEDLTAITRAVAASINHSSLSDELAEIGYNVFIDTTS